MKLFTTKVMIVINSVISTSPANTIAKSDSKVLVLVENISLFRCRYIFY